MKNDFEVIAAFADGERVHADALKMALATDEGRQYLIDTIALREVAGEETQGQLAPAARPTRRRVRWVAMAAGVALAIAGAYQAGASRAAGLAAPAATSVIDGGSLQSNPPEPTVVIKLR